MSMMEPGAEIKNMLRGSEKHGLMENFTGTIAQILKWVKLNLKVMVSSGDDDEDLLTKRG